MKREASRTIQPSKDAQSAASASSAARPGLQTLAGSTRIPTPEPPSLDHLSGIFFRESDPCRMPRRHAHSCLLCFHNLTNSFSRNPFPLTSIQIAGGCHPLAEQLSKPKLEPKPPNSSPTNKFSVKPRAGLLVQVPPASCRPLLPMSYSRSSARLHVKAIPIARAVALRYSVGSLGLRKLVRRKLASGPTACR